jgi:hypothetical protein
MRRHSTASTTVGDGHRPVAGARLPALAVATVLVGRRAPFLVVAVLVVAVLAAATTALLHALT